jgi:hypothetical protein
MRCEGSVRKITQRRGNKMTEIVIGKEALMHLLNKEGIVGVLDEPKNGEVHGSIETEKGFMTFRYPGKGE